MVGNTFYLEGYSFFCYMANVYITWEKMECTLGHDFIIGANVQCFDAGIVLTRTRW